MTASFFVFNPALARSKLTLVHQPPADSVRKHLISLPAAS
jgi:hypothetical protein